MSPREEDQEELVDHISIRHIKVMLERGEVDISVDLNELTMSQPRFRTLGTYILLYVFCSMLQRRLSNLEAHLRCGV